MNVYQELAKLLSEKEEIQSKIDNLKEIAKQNKGQKWIPQLNDSYYVPTPLNEDFCYQRVWQNESDDVFRLNAGLVCQAPTQASEIGRKMYYRQWFESLSDVTEQDWKDDEIYKYYCYWDYHKNEISIDSYHFMKPSNGCFKTKENLKQAIQTVGEENTKKYVLGVK
jgi:hypothetical protein